MAAKESELSLLHSLLTNVFTLDCKTCIDEGIPMDTKQGKTLYPGMYWCGELFPK